MFDAGPGLIALGVLVLLNGFFVAAEFSLVTIRRTRVEQMLAERRPGARNVQDAIANLDSYIAACQLGITMASLALGWIGEPALAQLIEPPVTALAGQFPVIDGVEWAETDPDLTVVVLAGTVTIASRARIEAVLAETTGRRLVPMPRRPEVDVSRHGLPSKARLVSCLSCDRSRCCSRGRGVSRFGGGGRWRPCRGTERPECDRAWFSAVLVSAVSGEVTRA